MVRLLLFLRTFLLLRFFLEIFLALLGDTLSERPALQVVEREFLLERQSDLRAASEQRTVGAGLLGPSSSESEPRNLLRSSLRDIPSLRRVWRTKEMTRMRVVTPFDKDSSWNSQPSTALPTVAPQPILSTTHYCCCSH